MLSQSLLFSVAIPSSKKRICATSDESVAQICGRGAIVCFGPDTSLVGFNRLLPEMTRLPATGQATIFIGASISVITTFFQYVRASGAVPKKAAATPALSSNCRVFSVSHYSASNAFFHVVAQPVLALSKDSRPQLSTRLSRPRLLHRVSPLVFFPLPFFFLQIVHHIFFSRATKKKLRLHLPTLVSAIEGKSHEHLHTCTRIPHGPVRKSF